MWRRTAILGAVVAALALPTALPADAQPKAAPNDWVAMSSSWSSARAAVSVVDVKSFGSRAYAVGNTVKGKKTRPWVQSCRKTKCKSTALPLAGRASTTVTSISGTDSRDMWAVGTIKRGKVTRPIFWRKTGGKWKVFHTGLGVKSADESLNITQIEVANKSKAFALGRYDYLDGKTSTLYRWNGTDWKELSDRNNNMFASPCDGWFNRNWSDIVVRSGSALLVGKCGVHKKTAILEQGNGSWELASGTNYPDQVVWSTGSYIGQEAWIAGTRSGNRVFYKRVNDRWSKVATKGIKGKAVVSDVAGPYSSKVMAVGWIATGNGHREAKAWRWGNGSWHETEVPAGVSRSQLLAVSVDSKYPFFAVGTDSARPANRRDLILRSR